MLTRTAEFGYAGINEDWNLESELVLTIRKKAVRHHTVLFCFLFSSLPAFAQPVPSSPPPQSHMEVAKQLTECYWIYGSFKGLAAAVDLKVDNEKFVKLRRITRSASEALVGEAGAKALRDSAKEPAKVRLATALEQGTPGVASYVEKGAQQCAALMEANHHLLAEQIKIYNDRNAGPAEK